MGARTGAQYIADLKKMRREIWIGGERVEDVTTHPATRRGVESYAHLYDMQHDPALRDVMTYPSPTSGERVGMSFLTPRTPTDVALRREMIKQWANYSGGMMGRTPDYCNSSFMAFASASEYFAANDPRYGENVRNYYQYIREHDLCLTHTLINPQANRGKAVNEQADPYLPAGIVETNSDGVVIRGCRMLATSAPLADEIMVFPSTVVRNADADKYAFAFSVPTDIPGMKFICRESLDLRHGRSGPDSGPRQEHGRLQAEVSLRSIQEHAGLAVLLDHAARGGGWLRSCENRDWQQRLHPAVVHT